MFVVKGVQDATRQEVELRQDGETVDICVNGIRIGFFSDEEGGPGHLLLLPLSNADAQRAGVKRDEETGFIVTA